MTTLQEKIDALPEWPKGGVPKHGSFGTVIALEHQAALARLALAREWIEAGYHRSPCLRETDMYEHPCTCGRDELLAALGDPNE